MTRARFLAAHASWLFRADLGTAIVGSAALAEACRRERAVPPRVGDLDLAWGLDTEAGERLLTERRVLVRDDRAQPRARHARRQARRRPGSRSRAIAARLGSLDQRLREDLAARDMTVGAVAWRLGRRRDRRPARRRARLARAQHPRMRGRGERVAEHPVRSSATTGRAHEWGFQLSADIQRLEPDARLLGAIPREALAQELRALLLRCASPGRALQALHDAGRSRMLVPRARAAVRRRAGGPGAPPPGGLPGAAPEPRARIGERRHAATAARGRPPRVRRRRCSATTSART
jgi:hypothetical protein